MAARPQLRGLLQSQVKRDFAIASVLSIAAPVLYKVFVTMPREKAYAEFYQSYDAEADYLRMRDAGVFQSVQPGGKVNSIDDL